MSNWLPKPLVWAGAVGLATVAGYFVFRTQGARLDVVAAPAHQLAKPGQGQDPSVDLHKSSTFSPIAVSRTDWNAKYLASTDAYAFVQEAALRALDGDGRAAYYVAETVTRCAGVNKELAGTSIDEKLAEREGQLAAVSAISGTDRAAMLARDRATYAFCERYARGDAFSTLPAAAGGYQRAAYWRGLAYEDADPMALANHAIETAHNPRIAIDPGADESKNALATAQEDINRALAQPTPDALFATGAVFGPPNLQSIPHQDAVLMLAACNLGYDCTAANPRLSTVFECSSFGGCAAGFSFDDYLKKYFGGDSNQSYADVYAAASALTEAIKRGDQQEIRKFTALPR